MGKYFKYAIGEIILVVIGILIALQINNWNENRKNAIKEKQLITSFKSDIEANIIELQRVIDKSEYTYKSADSILMIYHNDIEDVNTDVFQEFALEGGSFTVYQTHEGTVTDILGSGLLDVIKNDSIRLAMSTWSSNLKNIREWEKLDKLSSEEYGRYLRHYIQFFNLGFDKPALSPELKTKMLSDSLFLNLVSDRSHFTSVSNELYKDELPKLLRLMDLINRELNND